MNPDREQAIDDVAQQFIGATNRERLHNVADYARVQRECVIQLERALRRIRKGEGNPQEIAAYALEHKDG